MQHSRNCCSETWAWFLWLFSCSVRADPCPPEVCITPVFTDHLSVWPLTPSCRQHELVSIVNGEREKDDSEMRGRGCWEKRVSEEKKTDGGGQDALNSAGIKGRRRCGPTRQFRYVCLRKVKGIILRMCWAVEFNAIKARWGICALNY